MKLRKLSILYLLFFFLIIIGSIIFLKEQAYSQEAVTTCAAEETACTINPGETVLLEIPEPWLTSVQSWKVKNVGNLPAIFVPKKTVEEYLSFIHNFPGIEIIESGNPEPDTGAILLPPTLDQTTPTTGGCSSTTWGTNCTVTASGGESTGAYEFNYVSGPCSINSSTGVVSSTGGGTCVVRVRKLGDSNYNDSSYSTNRSITLNKQNQSTPTTGGCSSTVWGTACTVTASGGAGTGAYEYNYVSGNCTINSSTGVVSSTWCGTCVVRVRKIGDANYNTSSYSSNRSISLTNKTATTPSYLTFNTPTYGVDQASIWGSSTSGKYYWQYSVNGGIFTGGVSTTSTSRTVASSIFGNAGNTIQIRVKGDSSSCYNGGEYRYSSQRTVAKASQTAPAAPTLNSASSDSITLNSCTGCEYIINPPQLNDTESFESSFGDWPNAAGNKSNWLRKTGSTSSSSTGPSSAYDGSYYIYIETSSNGSYYSGDTDIIEYNIGSSISGYVDFAYHQYGSNQGVLYLEGWNGSTWTTIWSSTGDQGNQWNTVGQASTSFTNYSKLRFRNVAAGGYRGDVALDKIEVYSGSGTYQASATFSGLSQNTSYSFTQRKAATANYNASAASTVVSFSTVAGGCTSPCGGTVSDGSSETCYLRCSTTNETRTCNSGSWSSAWTAGYTYASANEACNSCSTETKSWLTNCSASFSEVSHGETRTANNTVSGYNGSATFSCSDGTWSYTSGTCADSTDPCYGQTSVTFNYNGSVVTYGTVSSAGKCWLDRNLGADQVATAYNDHLGYGDLFQWGRGADGHQLINWTSATAGTPVNGSTATLSSSDTPGDSLFITSSASPDDWRSPQNNNLWQGETGINNPCPSGWRVPTETEINNQRLTWSINGSEGAYGSALKWSTAGLRNHISASLDLLGSLGLVWSSSVSSTNGSHLYFNSSYAYIPQTQRARGLSVRCLRDDFTNYYLKYSNTSGGSISGDKIQAVSGGSSGSAVTATPDSGYVFVQWSDGSTQNPRTDTNVTSNIDVVAEFTLFTCGNSVTFSYNGSSETYGTVSRGGKCWLDRNLGADRAATASNDHLGYGDLFQWGRDADGHQLINWTSSTAGTPVNGSTATLSSSDTPGDSLFITTSASPYDWRSPQNDNLWQGETGINNPCSSGWRIPTEAELNAERLSWGTNNSAGAYASTLKWPIAGLRNYGSASLGVMGSHGSVWSSSVSSDDARFLRFYSSSAGMYSLFRPYGFSVRCLRD